MREEWEAIERRGEASADRAGQLVALGVVAMLAYVAGSYFFGGRSEPPAPLRSPAADVVDRSVPTVMPEPATEAPEPRAPDVPRPRSGGERYVGVYECTVNGQRVVSDRPCAPEAQLRTLVIDQPDPREVARQRQMTQSAGRSGSSYYASPSAGSQTSRPSSTATASNEAACEAVDRAIDNLNARMRQRYSAAEGERLRAQWHDLKRQRYDLRCGR